MLSKAVSPHLAVVCVLVLRECTVTVTMAVFTTALDVPPYGVYL